MPLSIGDTVVYTAQFLKSIGTPPTAQSWSRRGKITELGEPWVKVLWDDYEEPVSIRPEHLTQPGLGIDYARGPAAIEYERIWGLNGYMKQGGK